LWNESFFSAPQLKRDPLGGDRLATAALISLLRRLFGRSASDRGAVRADPVDEVMRLLEPPSDLRSGAAWDGYWGRQIAFGLGPPLFDMMVNNHDLVILMRKEGFRTVLLVGNGISLEPRALATAGFEVVALDISPRALQIAQDFPLGDDYLASLIGPRAARAGGRVEFVVGDVLDPTVCGGPFDVIVERRTAQNYPDETRGAFLAALVARLSGQGILVSHCHDAAWRPGRERRHVTGEWFRARGWPILGGAPDRKPPGQVAWLVSSTG